MKFHKTSGNQAAPKNAAHNSELPPAHGNVPAWSEASPHAGKHQMEFTYVNSPPVPIEPLVTKKTLSDHYGLSIRTINYCLTLGLPKVQVGAHVRFRLSEVQPWFEQN